MSDNDLANPMVMMMFYRRLFPFKQLFLWLNHANASSPLFSQREIAFTLQNDAYSRYNSFTNAEDLKKEVVRLNPSRFEVGPVYSAKPKDRKYLSKSSFRPILRELVFDIDMTDYDDVRTCCSDKKVCRRCWKFIAIAIDVLDRVLREDFGYKDIVYVYSGRRGIHCWVSDAAAMALNDEQRRALVNYVEVIKGGTKMDKKVSLPRPLHPSLQLSYEALKGHFAGLVLKDQECFRNETQWETLLRLLPEEHAKALARQFNGNPKASSNDKWNAVLKPKNMTGQQNDKFKNSIQDIIFQYTYPRIDTEVSKHLNHLLKSPFCVHPGTGRVCVPLTLEQIHNFDPESVPTVGQLMKELESVGADEISNTLWDKTSLKPYVEYFDKYVNSIVKTETRVKREERKETLEF